MRFDNKDIGMFSDEASEENKPKKKKGKKVVKITENQFDRLFTEDYYDSRKEIDDYKDGDDLVGEHLWVHTNRTHRNNGWNGMIGIYRSTKRGNRTGSPQYYTNEIRLKSPIHFQTSDTGAERIKQSGQRTLIAGVSGVVVPTKGSLSGFEEITYSPFEEGYFISTQDPDRKEIISAEEVYFKSTEEGEYFVFAKGIEYSDNSLNESSGDKNLTFKEIYDTMYSEVFNSVCRRYTKDRSKAQDYCQNGFIKVYEKLDRYSGSGSIEGWVKYVVKNNILDEIRKKKLEYSDDFDFDRLEVEEIPYEEPEYTESDIKSAMEHLSPKYRKIFEMYFFEKKKHQEIAEELGISEGTSKSNLFKAKKKIRKILMDTLTEQEESSDSTTTPSGGSSSTKRWEDMGRQPQRGKANPIDFTSTWETGVTRGPANPI